ncbi:MAG: hypothetical protein QGF94_00785 [Candidatus Thalassarchaeaceae archaeon]|nr:hypothetical protein [Candidatus Thalassarchaeaceae archaeon]
MTNRKRILSMTMIGLMLFSTTLVHAATVSTFASGGAEVTVELRDQGVWADDLTAGIELPAGETVNSAGLIVGTDSAIHNHVDTIDASIMDHIWNPAYNTGLTQYSSNSDFTVDEDYIKMISLGYNADFEASREGWTPGLEQGPNMVNWGHGSSEETPPELQSGCGVGDWCWGTDFTGFDYTQSLPNGEYQLELTSESFYVNPGKSDLSFKSFHNMFYREAGTNQYYYDDCAYVAVMNSTNNQDWNDPIYMPFNIGSTTGVSPNNGLYALGAATNQVPNAKCNFLGTNGPQIGDYVLGGNGTTSGNTPGGWSDIEIDLSGHSGRYAKIVFIMEVNDHGSAFPVEPPHAGWYIDGVRVGDPLPAQGHVIMSSFAPQSSGQPGFPDGYGVLQLDLVKASSADFGVDVLDAGTGAVITDINGNVMSDLQGSLIELWDIDGDTHPLIDLKFNFGSGSNRLSSPVLHGFHIGTRIGTTFNNTDGVFILNGTINSGKWVTSMAESSAALVTAAILDDSFTPPVMRTSFSKPIVAVKPIIVDSCGGPTSIGIMSMNEDENALMGMTDQWTSFSVPTFTFGMMIEYATLCDVFSIHADIQFAHNSRGISLDVAADGDIEWGMTDPAFGRFGLQDMFRTGIVNGINEGDTEREIALDINLHGEGAPFLLPKGASITYAEISHYQNGIGGFNMTLVSGNQQEDIGEIEDLPFAIPSPGSPLVSMQDQIQSLLDNPLVPTAWVDAYGNEWYLFRIMVDSNGATPGSTITFRDLHITYDWSRAINDDNNVARELNQGVALASSGSAASLVVVPMRIIGGSGGAISLSSLSVSTTGGYDSTLNSQGITGMYPNGDIIEIITTHDVSSATGQTLGGASLLFETTEGNLELLWDATNDSFWEETDPDDYLDFMSMQSLSTDLSSGKELRWRFRVNPSWDDVASVRLYAAALSNTGVNGLPAGVLIEPSTGNAVENDVSITEFHLFNQGGIEQLNLSNAYSSNTITLEFNVRYEDLDVAPNANSYQMLLQKRNQSNLSEEWIFVDSTSATLDGDYMWSPSLPLTEVGTEHYRLMIDNYTDGTTNCPPSSYSPDELCAIRFSMTLDPFSPHLVNISVFSVQGDWRELSDDTWVPASNNQKFRIAAQDLPLAPETLTLNYWVEAEHDCGLDGLCPNDVAWISSDAGELDREAQYNEYSQIGLIRETATDTSMYYIDHPCQCISDYANSGIDPPQMVSLFVSGGDIGGNSIDGGSIGVNHDLVTYIGMDSRTPYPQALRITDSHGTELNDVNKSMYAGNIYHLLVDARDENGWRDVDYISIALNPSISNPLLPTYDPDGAIVLFYSAQNDTAWTEYPNGYLEIIDDYENTGLKPEMLTQDGAVLISPFEQYFTVDIPIRLGWSIPSAYVGGVMTPAVNIKDLDLANNEVNMGQQRAQKWDYASDFQLDTTTFVVEDTSGFASSGVGLIDGGFVNSGDILRISGRYVFNENINSLVFVSPEIPLTLELTRTAAFPNGGGPGQYQASLPTTETFSFENGTFELLIPASTATNEYTYSLELIGLPTGAVDETPTPSRNFYVNVDGTAPVAVFNSWEISNHETGVALQDGRLSSSIMNCVDVEVYIDELQRMDTDSVEVNWMFYQTQEVGGFQYNWTDYLTTFETPWLKTSLDLDRDQGQIRATSVCLDLWPGEEIPAEMDNVIVKFWITGHDSAGREISGGGSFGDEIKNGMYGLEYEAAEFTLTRVSLSTQNPMAEDNFDLLIDLRNDGNKPGNLTIMISTIIGGVADTPNSYTCPETVSPGNEYLWRLEMPQFPEPATNVKYVILDTDGDELYSTESFNVARYTSQEDDGGMMLWVGIAGVIILLIVAVVIVLMVLNRGQTEDEDEYIDDEDFLPPGEAVQPMRSRGPPATRDSDRRGPPGASRGPPAAEPARSPMEIAKEKFPFWDDATIQGYFDQGWSVEQLEEWLASQ